MSRYNDLIKTLPNINLDIISKICYELVPKQFRDCPWKIAYGDKNFGKIFTTEDELNAYATAYTDWHKGKLERTFDNTPREAFSGDISVIDWGCGQGLATLYLYEYLIEKGINGQIKEVILIEPSKKALARAKFNIGLVNSNIDIITVNKQLNDILDKDILLSEKRKTIHLFSNILDIKDISLKQISERLKINLSKDNYIL